jgi:hypothetical protein
MEKGKCRAERGEGNHSHILRYVSVAALLDFLPSLSIDFQLTSNPGFSMRSLFPCIWFSIAIATPHPHPHPYVVELDDIDRILTPDPEYQQQQAQLPFPTSPSVDLLSSDANIDDGVWFPDTVPVPDPGIDYYLSPDDWYPNLNSKDINLGLNPNLNDFDINDDIENDPNTNLYLSSTTPPPTPSTENSFDDKKFDPTARCPLDFYLYPACCGELLSQGRYILDCTPST